MSHGPKQHGQKKRAAESNQFKRSRHTQIATTHILAKDTLLSKLVPCSLTFVRLSNISCTSTVCDLIIFFFFQVITNNTEDHVMMKLSVLLIYKQWTPTTRKSIEMISVLYRPECIQYLYKKKLKKKNNKIVVSDSFVFKIVV